MLSHFLSAKIADYVLIFFLATTDHTQRQSGSPAQFLPHPGLLSAHHDHPHSPQKHLHPPEEAGRQLGGLLEPSFAVDWNVNTVRLLQVH